MTARPDHDTVRAAIALACRAPSVGNTQPWRFALDDGTIHLKADRCRQLPATDPQGRDLLISCGAALHHLRVALGSFGWSTTVRYEPDRTDRDHLAVVTMRASTPTPEAIALTAALIRRRSNRRASAPWPVPYPHLDLLTVAAYRAAAVRLVVLRDARSHTATARDSTAAAGEDAYPGCRADLPTWSGVAAQRVLDDGAPAGHGLHDSVMRSFARGTLAVAESAIAADDGAELLAVTTTSDEPLDWVHAGEAASAVMLTATSVGMASCPLSQATETPAARTLVADQLRDGAAIAQLVVRVVWAAADAEPLPPTPRRPLDEVLDHLPDTGRSLPVSAASSPVRSAVRATRQIAQGCAPGWGPNRARTPAAPWSAGATAAGRPAGVR